MSLIFVDCEAVGPSVSTGRLTEFGAVEFHGRSTFHGHPELCPRAVFSTTWDPEKREWGNRRLDNVDDTWEYVFHLFEDWLSPLPLPLVFVSDNPAYDWQWINDGFHRYLGHNPFGHSARRIGDFYAGLTGRWRSSSRWKRFRVTPHDHHPVHDAMGNVEAFAEILKRHPNTTL